MKELLLARGVLFFTKDDIKELQIERLAIRKSLYIKFSFIVPSIVLLITIILLLTKELMTPKVGDIGLFSTDGETTPLKPIINPSPTKENAFNYAVDAATEIRSFFFSTYFNDIKKLEPLFTPEAYNSYLLSLSESGIFTRVQEESLNVTAVESPRSQVNAAYNIEDGVPYYYVRVKLLLRIEGLSGEDEYSSEELFFKLQEVDRGKSKHGLLISSLEPF